MRAHDLSSTPADQFVAAFEKWLPAGLTADIDAEDERSVFIEYIEGRGYGIVDMLCQLADKFGVTLTLGVDIYHQYDGGKLVPYYQSKGFALDGYNGSECFDADGNFDLSMLPDDADGEYFHGCMGMKREPQLTEAPIADYQFIDRADDPHPVDGKPVGDSFPDEDLRAMRSAKWQAKLLTTFEKSFVPINLYLFNKAAFQHRDTRRTTDGDIVNHGVAHPGQGAWELAKWAGAYPREDFKATFGFLPPNSHKNVNVLLTQNWGDGRVPLTPWIVAHRIVHALSSESSVRLKGPHFFPMGNAFERGRIFMAEAERAFNHAQRAKGIRARWGQAGSDEDFADFAQATGTFASARHRKLERSGEFIIEMMTQFLLFNQVKVNLDWLNDDVNDRRVLEKLLYRFQVACEEGFHACVGQLIVF